MRIGHHLCVAVLVTCTLGAHDAAGSDPPGIPRPIGAIELYTLLDQVRGPGVQPLSPAAWRSVEACLDRYYELQPTSADPARRALIAEFPAQHWLNWGALKERRAHELHDAAVDAALQAEADLFLCIRATVVQSRDGGGAHGASDVVEEARLKRRRSGTPAIPRVEGATFADVVDVVEQVVPQALEGKEVRSILREWARAVDERLDSLWALQRRTREAYRAALAGAGIDAVADQRRRHEWLPQAYDIWLDVSPALRHSIVSLIDVGAEALERVAHHLDADEAQRLRDAWLARTYHGVSWRIAAARAPAKPMAALDGAADAVATAHRAWWDQEAPLRERLRQEIRAHAPVSWPLMNGGWRAESDHPRLGPHRQRIEELELERRRILQELQHAVHAVGGRLPDGPRSIRASPLVLEAPSAIRCASPLGMTHEEPALEEIGFALPSMPVDALRRLGLRLIADQDHRALWFALIREHEFEVAQLAETIGPAGSLPVMFLRHTRVDRSVMTRLLEVEGRRAAEIVALDSALFLRAAWMLPTGEGSIMQLLEAWRSLERDLAPVRKLTAITFDRLDDRRAFANVLDPILVGLIDIKQRRLLDTETLVTIVEAMLEEVRALEEISKLRHALAMRHLTDRHVHYHDPLPDDRPHLVSRRTVDAWWREDGPLRERFAAAQEALIQDYAAILRGELIFGVAAPPRGRGLGRGVDRGVGGGLSGRSGILRDRDVIDDWGGRAIAEWNAAAWPAAHGIEFPIRERIEREAARAMMREGAMSQLAASLIELVRWFDEEFAAITAEFVDLARGMPPDAMLDHLLRDGAKAEHEARRSQLEARRTELAERATVRLALELRDAG